MTTRREKVKRASPWTREFDFSEAYYTPHTVLALLCMLLCMLLFLRYYQYPDMDVVSSVKHGLVAAALTFIGFGALHLPDSVLVRPHPALWRAALACGLLYVLLLTFLLFQNLKTVHTLMGYYDPSVRVTLPERSYATDCRLSTPEEPFLFFKTSFDVFVIAHSLGYIVKTLILRDWRMVTCVSVGFEVFEITFQHALPNFRECWWDHVLLDVLICNGGGTVVGLWLLRALKAKQYRWIALSEIPTMKGKARRLLGQLGPRSFETYHWNVFESPKRLLQICGVLGLMFVQEMNCFTMKAILNLEPKHHLVTGRLFLWSVLAVPAMREYYEYMNNSATKRIGTTAWVTTLGLAVESIFIAKMALEGNYFQVPFPLHIAVPWVVAIVLLSLWFGLFFGFLSSEQRYRKRGMAYFVVNLPFYGACLSVAGMILMGMPELHLGRALFEREVTPYVAFLRSVMSQRLGHVVSRVLVSIR